MNTKSTHIGYCYTYKLKRTTFRMEFLHANADDDSKSKLSTIEHIRKEVIARRQREKLHQQRFNRIGVYVKALAHKHTNLANRNVKRARKTVTDAEAERSAMVNYKTEYGMHVFFLSLYLARSAISLPDHPIQLILRTCICCLPASIVHIWWCGFAASPSSKQFQLCQRAILWAKHTNQQHNIFYGMRSLRLFQLLQTYNLFRWAVFLDVVCSPFVRPLRALSIVVCGPGFFFGP